MSIDQPDLLRKLEATIASWNDEVTQAQSQLSDQIADTRSQLVTLVRLLASRTENGDALTEALDDIQELQAELKSRDGAPPPQESTGLHEELSGLRSSIEGFHERDRQTEELNRDLETRIAELRTREEMNEEALAQARRELEALQGTLTERDETVRTATDNTSSLSHTLSLLQKEFESLRSDAEQAVENDAAVRNEINALRTAIEDRLAQPSEPVADMSSFTEQIADAARKEQSLQTDLAALQDELRQRTLDLAQAETERDEASAESRRVQDELRKAAEALASVEEELGRLRQSLVEKVDAESGLSGELEHLKVAHSEMEAYLLKAREENATLEARLQEAQSSQTAAEERVSKFSDDQEASSKALAQAEEYLLTAEEAASDSVDKQESLSGDLAELSTRINEKSSQLEQYHVDIDALRAELSEKENENLRLLEELDLLRAAADRARSSDALSALIVDGETGAALGERKAELLTYEAYLIEREALLGNAVEELDAYLDRGEEEALEPEALQGLRDKAKFLSATALDIGKDEFGRLLLDDADRPERAKRWGDLLCRAGLITGEEKDQCLAARESGSPNPLGKLLEEKNITREDVLHRILFALGEAAPADKADAGQLDEAKKDANRYREIANQANVEAGESRALIQEREETITQLNEIITDRDHALDSIQGDLQALQQSHAQEFERSTEKLRDAESTIEGLKEKLARGSADVDALQAEIDGLNERFTPMENELASRDEEITTLRTALTESRDTLEQRAASEGTGAEMEQARSAAFEEERKGLEAKTVELSESLAERDLELSQRRGELDALREETETLNQRLTPLDNELASRDEEITTLHTALTEAQDSLKQRAVSEETGADKDQARSAAFEEERKTLEAAASHLLESLTERDRELGEGRAELDVLREETESLNQRLTPLENGLASRDEELALLRANLAEAEKRVENPPAPDETALQEAEARHAALEDEWASLESKVTQLSGTVAKRDSDAEELRAQLAPLQSELDESKKEIEHLKEGLSAAENQVAELVEELSATQLAITASEDAAATAGAEEKANLEDRVAELTDQIEERDDNLASVKRDLEDASMPVAPDSIQISRATPESAWGEQPPPEDEDPIAKAAYDERGRKRSMGEILVEAGTLTQDQLDLALAEQRSSSRRRLGTIIVENGWADEETISQVLAAQLRMPFVRLPDEVIELYAADLLDGTFATHHMCMPIRVEGTLLVIAMANPLDLIAVEDIERRTELTARPVVATLADITAAIVKYYGSTFKNGDGPKGS